MIRLVLILLICIVIFNCIVYNSEYKCKEYPINYDSLTATRLPGNIFDNRIGIKTINLKLEKDIECGIYKVVTFYGPGILFISRGYKRLGYLYSINIDAMEGINFFNMWNIERLYDTNNHFINTYNRGCC
jgi:hypothetical protein